VNWTDAPVIITWSVLGCFAWEVYTVTDIFKGSLKAILPRPSRKAAHVLCDPGVEIRNNLFCVLFEVSRSGSLLVRFLHLFFHLPSGFCSQRWLMDLDRRKAAWSRHEKTINRWVR